jgi:alpha-glucosidase
MWNADARRAEMARLQRWGVKGIKVDFFQSDKQHIIAQYLDILRDAAEFQLMVNFHGCTIPRGWERTYPHLLTMEAVKGAEAYSFDQSYPVNAPAQNTIFAATRNVIGPMDYTPVTFSDNTYPHITTNPHELALGVIFESGAQHLADRVEAYFEAPEAVRNFLRDLPVAWDETRFVRGEPGKEFIIARRRGDIWYVAGINGEAKNKEWRLDLSFTGKANAIPGLLIGDDANPRGFAIRAMDVHPEFGLPVKLRACGGFVLRLGEKGF